MRRGHLAGDRISLLDPDRYDDHAERGEAIELDVETRSLPERFASYVVHLVTSVVAGLPAPQPWSIRAPGGLLMSPYVGDSTYEDAVRVGVKKANPTIERCLFVPPSPAHCKVWAKSPRGAVRQIPVESIAAFGSVPTTRVMCRGRVILIPTMRVLTDHAAFVA